MTKQRFLEELEKELSIVPSSDREEVLADYREHIEVGVSEGRKEEEVIESLGNPKEIAKQYRFEGLVNKAEKKFTPRGIVEAVFAAVSLGFFNVVFLLGPFIAAMGILFTFYAVAFSIAFGGIVTIVSSIADPLTDEISIGVNPLGGFLIGLSLIFLSILFLIANWLCTKVFYKLTISYLRLNINIIKHK